MTKTMKPALVFLSDTHVREDRPKARTDDYQQAMWRKIDSVLDTAYDLDVPIAMAGDFFDKPKVSPWLERETIEKLNEFSNEIIIIPGQHDLPHHNMQNLWKSSLGVVVAGVRSVRLLYGGMQARIGSKSIVLDGFQWGNDFVSKPPEPVMDGALRIAVVHATIVKSDKDKWPGAVDVHSAESMLDAFQCYDLVISGDNHKPFVHSRTIGTSTTTKTIRDPKEKRKQTLVNCGSMMRMIADQKNYEPAFYVLYADEKNARKFEIETIPFEIEKGVVTQEHIISETQRDERMGLFVESLDKKYKKGFSFRDNMERFLGKNKIRKPIQDIIWEAFDE